ncbi:flagellar M-ring protein FliF C-terminal domain-containing protein [Clostridium thermobutyricum]|uniref:Flagellar MS-ring protein n=1 Tax=Clostridium thermobutyricum DSM 4928 TaxID=1121339 RepID=A0A1V4SQ11_9CLOT|nr:flagellar M-ring protein FliF C-terminal domain-containing protein [Clostridium thermobutyricum]OPX45337.1 flagellar MS-ring protein [Clostridium thermobutyricum DSM 4928]
MIQRKKTETVIDPNKVIVSQQTISEGNSTSNGATSESPVDNNMSNTIEENNSGVKSSKNEQSTNYESGKTETQVISAPGEVKRLTASVIIDGNLDTGTINTITQSVENAIGLNSERGDKISVASMDFDPAIKMEQENQIKEFNKWST